MECPKKCFAPHHGKTELDGFFGSLSKAKFEGARNRMILDVCDIKQVYDEWAAAASKQGNGPDIAIVEFVPPPKATVEIFQFTSKCMGPIRFGYHWKVVRTDVRRKNFRGKPPLQDTLIGLSIRSSGSLACRGGPQLVDAAVDAVEDGKEEEYTEDEDDVLEKTTQIFNGWRTSYCKLDSQPERRVRLQRYLASAVKALGLDFQNFGNPPMRRATAAVRQAKDHASKNAAKARQQNWTRFFKERRSA